MKELLDYARDHTDDILTTLRQIVEVESFTPEKLSVDTLSSGIRDRLEALDARVQVVPQPEFGNHLLADWGEGPEQVLILCHMDTVWPQGTLQQKPFRVEDGLAYGPGILDMKAGIAIILHAMEALRSLGLSPQRRVRNSVDKRDAVKLQDRGT